MTDNFSSTPLPPGTKIGAYCIERLIAHGGMADVYYAVHQQLHRPAAIKILRPSLATDEVHLQRFMQEARATASLVHPNIVQIYDVGQDGEHRYIAQEFIPGSNLRQYLSSSADNSAAPNVARRSVVGIDNSDGPNVARRSAVGTDNPVANSQPNDQSSPSSPSPAPECSLPGRQLSIRETLSVLLQVLAALNKSAASGIVHRDIKPENIMLTQDGDVKVADFGLARLLQTEDPQLTRAGTTLGTPMYMSPEQIQEGLVDIRSDLYSLGVTLYHMLCGRPPFTGETSLALAMQHVQASAPDIRQFRSDVPDMLRELLLRLLAKKPQDRPDDPSQALEYLRSGRYGELQQDWPDQTVPFPGVAGLARRGPSQATLVLQAKLIGHSGHSGHSARSLRRRWLPIFATAALLVACFGTGAMLAFSTPLRLFESQEKFYWDVGKQANAEAQYRWALLNNDGSQLTKWEAVGHFFPKQDKPINRMYVGLASLQLARAHFERKDPESALQVLRATLDDREMGPIVRALAYLLRAEIAAADGQIKERDMAIQRALEIAAAEEAIGSEDLPRLDENVRLMDPSIQDIWFGRKL